jgi:hypothetical protein
MDQSQKQSDILSCARYAFRPNFLKYCGPDQNGELLQYLRSAEDDGGVGEILKKFETLYPYLRLIARENKTGDLFDKKISEAYWVGNDLLANVKMARLHEHLADGLKLKKKLSQKELDLLVGKISHGANPHHSFHVFNIWQRTGHVENPHTLFTMDECRIGWGAVVAVAEKTIDVVYEPLVFANGKLAYGAPTPKKIFYELRDVAVSPGDWITFHWSSFCDVLEREQLENLKKWTGINLELANVKMMK